MIHPIKNNRTLIAVGYWYSEYHTGLPKPQDFEDKTVDEEKRKMLVNYLNSGKRCNSYRGYSNCRYRCGIENKNLGSTCLTDGKYVWPEGLSHYIEAHHVWLPQLFIEHVVSNKSIKGEDKVLDDKAEEGDLTWWQSFV
jgi:hypothetical protein